MAPSQNVEVEKICFFALQRRVNELIQMKSGLLALVLVYSRMPDLALISKWTWAQELPKNSKISQICVVIHGYM